jgi:hypothetical protein
MRAEGVPFCIARNHQEFWHDGPSDVDMIVSPDHLTKAQICFGYAARQSGYRLASLTAYDNLCLVYHAPGAGFVRIDIDTAVRWRTRTLLGAESVLECRIEMDGLPIPCPEHESLILLCQCAWAGKAKSSYRERLATLLGTDAFRVTRFLNSRFGIDQEFLQLVIRGSSVKMLRRRFRHAKTPQQRLLNIAALILRSIKRIQRPPGIVITCPGLTENERTAISEKLELLFPTAKEASGNCRFFHMLNAIFRGGIVWDDRPGKQYRTSLARLWTGAQRSFRCMDGMIHHPASNQKAPTEMTHDFIGSTLADILARSR